MRLRSWVGAAVGVAVVFGAARRAQACDYGYNTLTVEETGAGAAPGPIGETTYSVKRGQGPKSAGCGQESTTSCDDVGSVALHFTVAEDADSAFEAVGYRVRVVEGRLPSSMALPADALRAYREGDGPEGTIWLYWTDGDTDDQEAIAFTLTLTPVDADGNEGPESDPIAIRDDGGSGGCGVGRGSAGESRAGVLLAAALALIARRRRRALRQ